MNKTTTGKFSAGLMLGALGVVFGDIGTSPLYVMKVIFGVGSHQLPIDTTTILGSISLVIWTVILVVAIQYIGCIMRADNKGEGGIMALLARLKSGGLTPRSTALFMLIGLIGVALFYGDSAITPAISVLSAVEGIKVTHPDLAQYVIPITLVILVILFWIQKYGTGFIGRLFGPVMLVWFGVIATGGLAHILQYPTAWRALLPTSGLHFVFAMPFHAFITMGAVVLAVTGAEALFADMGHFGRPAIARGWFWVVFPALLLCYVGQGAVLLENPGTATNPFFNLFPAALHLPVVVLAALATLIASQSVIAGAFSLTRQAVQLGFLPHLTTWHTSDRETGQIYVPSVNFLLFVAVMLFVVLFGSSVRLAGAYGVAVSGAITVDTILFLAVISTLWRKWRAAWILPGIVFLAVDLLLVIANIPKIPHGGWLPLVVAILLFLVIDTWRKGEAIVARERKDMEGPLDVYVDQLHRHKPKHLVRVPGQAIFIGHHLGMAPLAFRGAIENQHELPRRVVIVYVIMTDAAHVHETERAEVNPLKYRDGISEVILRYGFHDTPNIPRALAALRGVSPELDFNPRTASYFISQTTVVPTRRRNMAAWRKPLYSLLARNSSSTTDYYKLPLKSTEEVHAIVPL